MIYFLYPGDLDTPTGGYRYDRRLIDELRSIGIGVKTVALPVCLPMLSELTREEIMQIFAAIPDQAIVVVDGLAFGVLDELVSNEALRLRFIALCHHPLALETGLDQQQRQALFMSEQRALSCARATVVTSPHTRKVLVDQFEVPYEKISVALPGTDRVPFSPCDGDPIRFLTLASLTQRKAHDVLIHALAPLQSLKWQARFVGGKDFDPAWAASLQQHVDNLGLTQRIELTGSVEDTRREYLQADVFVLPSRFEGYGMVFAEALAAGLPIIAARSGAVPDVVPDDAGVLVAPDDIDALSDVLYKIITDGIFRKTLQNGARQAAAALPSWRDTAMNVARKLEEIERS